MHHVPLPKQVSQGFAVVRNLSTFEIKPQLVVAYAALKFVLAYIIGWPIHVVPVVLISTCFSRMQFNGYWNSRRFLHFQPAEAGCP